MHAVAAHMARTPRTSAPELPDRTRKGSFVPSHWKDFKRKTQVPAETAWEENGYLIALVAPSRRDAKAAWSVQSVLIGVMATYPSLIAATSVSGCSTFNAATPPCQ